MHGSALKVCMGVGGAGVENEFSDRLWLQPSLGQAERKNIKYADSRSKAVIEDTM
jgi:hypothetical protein